MSRLMDYTQEKVTVGTLELLTFSFRIVVSLVWGLTLALIGEHLLGFGDFSFMVVILSTMGLLMKWSANWTLLGTSTFILTTFLLGLSIKMYISMAPGV